MQEIMQTVYTCENQISENRVKAFEVELERLQSKIDNLKSQNDLLTLTLDESKFHCDRLTVLMGKYESNFTAIQLAMNYADRVIESYEVLVSLVETDLGLLLSNCRAAGLGSFTNEDLKREIQGDCAEFVGKAQLARRGAEHVARQYILRNDPSNTPKGMSGPWEDLSSNSRTTR